MKQPNLEARIKNMIKSDGLKFKDLNKEVSDSIRSRGGKVIISVNITLPWIVGNVEPLADAFIAGL
jgi:hypothetical protein